MNIELADFQLKAIADLMEAMECDKKEIIISRMFFWRASKPIFLHKELHMKIIN